MRKPLAFAAAATAAATMALAPAASATTQSKDKVIAYGVSGRSLVRFDVRTPFLLKRVAPVTGLARGERVVGIDFRPRTGELVALGSRSNVYAVDTRSGGAQKKSTLNVAGTPVTLAGTSFGVDFNPTVDRLRVISNDEQNLRVNVDTGATTVDTALAYAGDDVNANMDPSAVGAAYTNNDNDSVATPPAAPAPGSTLTQLFAIDSRSDSLALQNPPNDGVLRTVGSLGVNTRKAVGFDVYSRLSGGRAVTNTAYAALRIRGITRLYTVDVASGDADNAGRIGLFGLSRVDDLAVQPQRG
jgi:Domain of unknown function (DUF4394)